MIDKVFFFEMENEKDREEACERLEMVKKQWEMADKRIIQDKTVKIAINDRILHYQIIDFIEDVLIFKQKTFQKTGVLS